MPEAAHDHRMKTIISLEQLTNIEDVSRFLDGMQAVAFGVTTSKKARYRWAQKTLVKHGYLLLGKAEKGIIIRYLMKVTGYSQAQIKRLIKQYAKTGTVTVKPARGNGFKRTYIDADEIARQDGRTSWPAQWRGP